MAAGSAAILAAFSGVPPENLDPPPPPEGQPRKNMKSAPQDAERSRQDAGAPPHSSGTRIFHWRCC